MQEKSEYPPQSAGLEKSRENLELGMYKSAFFCYNVAALRILHGKGDGILRQLIRQYLSTVPNVKHFADEHVQFGGAGITVAEIG